MTVCTGQPRDLALASSVPVRVASRSALLSRSHRGSENLTRRRRQDHDDQSSAPTLGRRLREADEDVQAEMLLAEILDLLALNDLYATVAVGEVVAIFADP